MNINETVKKGVTTPFFNITLNDEQSSSFNETAIQQILDLLMKPNLINYYIY